MIVTAKNSLKFGSGKNKIVIAKATVGFVKGISNSQAIRESFPSLEEKSDGWFYIIQFPDVPEVLVSKDQLNVSS